MRTVCRILIVILTAFSISQAQAANGRLGRIQVISACPMQTVTSRGQTVQISATCLEDYTLAVGRTGAGTAPHTYRLRWAGGTRGPATTSASSYSFTHLSGAATYTASIDEGAGGDTWTITVGAATTSATLTVLTPQGGETWLAGSTAAVTWMSAGLSASSIVKIQLNRSYPGGVWETLTASTPNDGAYSFTLTGDAATAARVRVVSASFSSIGDTSDGDFTIVTPSMAVMEPNGAESWTVGDTYDITWASSGGVGDNVKIELQRGYPLGTWDVLTASTANTGSWSWTVAGAATPAARIRVSGTTLNAVADTSDADFAIISNGLTPTVTVTLPNGGEYWPVGSAQMIYWTSTHLAEPVKIEVNRSYPTDDWELLAAAAPNTGSFAWTISGSVTGTARVRITGTSNTDVTDVSDAMFIISAGSIGGGITVTGPNGGDLWVIGSVRTVTWSAPTLTGNVKIEINRQYPAGTWTTVIPSTANDGAHSWLVTPSPTSGARVRVSSITTPTTHDISDGPFTITASLSQNTTSIVESVAEVEGPVPTEAYLAQNFPNPFNPTTTLEFGLPEAGRITVRVFDITGREVALLIHGAVAAGRHRILWNCQSCAAGVYLVALEGEGFSVVQKATFLK